MHVGGYVYSSYITHIKYALHWRNYSALLDLIIIRLFPNCVFRWQRFILSKRKQLGIIDRGQSNVSTFLMEILGKLMCAHTCV